MVNSGWIRTKVILYKALKSGFAGDNREKIILL